MAKKQQESKEYVLVNIMYSGDYVNEKSSTDENIGHEWINLHQADNGKHYIFITKTGIMDSNRKINNVLLVRAVSKTIKLARDANNMPLTAKNGRNKYVPDDNCVEVIAKAVGCHSISDENGNPTNWESFNDTITYSGISLAKLFSRNVFNGKREGSGTISSTYIADKVVKVKPGVKILLRRDTTDLWRNPSVFTNGEKKGNDDAEVKKVESNSDPDKPVVELFLNKCPNNQSLRLYIDPNEMIQVVLNNTDLWECNPVGKVSMNDNSDTVTSCFLTTIGKLKDELSYSNMIAHYLREDDEVCAKFVKWLLEKDNQNQISLSTGCYFSVAREEGHVDLLIRDKDAEGKGKYLIVIENKILSGINGKKDEGGQLTDYAKKAWAMCESELMPPAQNPPKNTNERKDEEGKPDAGKATNQSMGPNPDRGRTPYFFILTPNYSRIDITQRTTESTTYKVLTKEHVIKDVNLEPFEYVPITYNEVYDFFNRRFKRFFVFFDGDEKQQLHFKEFLTALNVHAQPKDNLNEVIMEGRAIRAIKHAEAEAKKQQK